MKCKKIVFILGIFLFLYPTFSDWWNSFHQSLVMNGFSERVESMDQKEYENYLKEAAEYNEKLAQTGFLSEMGEKERETYYNILDPYENGMMGYVMIPSIECKIPIYHGTGEAVLQIGAGHMEGSSFPIGGENTHCIISGHRGLPSARLFSSLDRVNRGDIICICVLNETLYYRVCQIQTVLPEDTWLLGIEKGKDLCTLVTCTPYGINTHRLLVCGERIKEMQMEDSTREGQNTEILLKGGTGFKVRKMTKWIVVGILIGLYWMTVGKDASAAQWEEPVYEIEINYPFAYVEFKLYKMESNTKKNVFVQSLVTDESGVLVFQNVKAGGYKIAGMQHEKDGCLYLPAGSEINIPWNGDSTVKRIKIKPKYEKVPIPESEDDTEKPEEGEKENQEEKEPVLPKTGQLWMPVLGLLLIGGVFLYVGWFRMNR